MAPINLRVKSSVATAPRHDEHGGPINARRLRDSQHTPRTPKAPTCDGSYVGRRKGFGFQGGEAFPLQAVVLLRRLPVGPLARRGEPSRTFWKGLLLTVHRPRMT